MKTLLLILCLTPAVAFADNYCRHEAARDLDVARDGARAIAFDMSSADIEVEGVRGLAGIEVRGRACASEEAWLSAMTVEQRREGDRIVVVARQAKRAGGSWGGGYSGFRLKVRVPSDLAVKIVSASGDASVDGVAALEFSASSGDVILRDIPGAVSVTLESGDLRGDNIGSLEVQHVSSGDIVVREIRGDARIGRIGSGDIRLVDVHGEVSIDHTNSGDISVRDVDSNVTIGPVGSGDVHVDGVGGSLRLAARRSDEDVHYRNVAGTVTFGD